MECTPQQRDGEGSVCCAQCFVCDASVSRAASQVTELSVDESQSCRLKVVTEYCCAAFDCLSLSQQRRSYKHLQNRNHNSV